MNSGAEFAVKV